MRELNKKMKIDVTKRGVDATEKNERVVVLRKEL